MSVVIPVSPALHARRRSMGMRFRRETDPATAKIRMDLRDQIEAEIQSGRVTCSETSWEIADNLYTNAETWTETIENRIHEYTRGDQSYFNDEMLFYIKMRLAFDLQEWRNPPPPTPLPIELQLLIDEPPRTPEPHRRKVVVVPPTPEHRRVLTDSSGARVRRPNKRKRLVLD